MRKFVSFSKYFTDITKDKKIIDCSKILALIPQCYDLFLHSLAFIAERISSYDQRKGFWVFNQIFTMTISD